MVHIKWTLWILIYVVCKKFVFCRKLILKALFRFNGTSKPSLTIALKILKTIDSNGWALKKTFNGDGPTLSKPSQNH